MKERYRHCPEVENIRLNSRAHGCPSEMPRQKTAAETRLIMSNIAAYQGGIVKKHCQLTDLVIQTVA